MFDISEKLIVGQSDEFFGVSPINWEDSSWGRVPLVNDEEVISLSHAKVYVFSESVLCLGKVVQNPTSKTVWEEKLIELVQRFNTVQNFGQLTESRWSSSGIFPQDSPHCSSSTKSTSS